MRVKKEVLTSNIQTAVGADGPLVVIQGVMSAETYINTAYITPGMLLGPVYVLYSMKFINFLSSNIEWAIMGLLLFPLRVYADI